MPKNRQNIKKWKKVRYPLQKKVVKVTLIGAVIVGLVMFAIGLGLYTYSLGSRYISTACQLTRSSAVILNDDYDLQGMTQKVLKKYRSLSEEELKKTGTQEYQDWFSFVSNTDEYLKLRSTLHELCESSDVNDLYIGYYDAQRQALVYICDPDISEQTGCFPGEWEAVSKRELDKFLAPDANEKIYDFGYEKRYGWIGSAGTPIYDDSDTPACFILADVTLADIGRGIRLFVLQYAVAFVIVVLILSRMMVKRMNKMVVDPINKIADAAQDYIKERESGMDSTEHFADLGIHTGDEVENLSQVMADMERSMAEYEENLTRITAEKERISTELELATRIQADMLPNTWPAFPERSEFDIYATMDPAREVGGDFYDFFLVDEDHLALVIADVSGKGIPAALLMMAAKIILANNAKMGKSPAQILESANTAICGHNHEEMFITVWLGILEISTGKLTAANAGHEYPVLKKAGGSFKKIKDQHGFVIGGMDDMTYEDYELKMEPGSKLFLYTDGIPEATNSRNELFGIDRMLKALNEKPDVTETEILRQVRIAVDHFVGEAEQFDDLTMLCLEYHGSKNTGDSHEI